MSKLYVVSTPIGNLKDITFRALETLKEVDLILCEDTRVTQKILSYYQIKKPTISFHKFSKENKYQKIFDLLNEGKNLALVSDAGTPAISDPGAFLIKEIKENVLDVKIISIPGPSSLISAVSIAGLSLDQFVFLGFPPQKKGRKTFFEELIRYEIPIVFFESKHRILKTLENIHEVLPNKEVFLVKEITKINEKYFEGKAIDIIKELNKDQNLLKGEFVIVLK